MNAGLKLCGPTGWIGCLSLLLATALLGCESKQPGRVEPTLPQKPAAAKTPLASLEKAPQQVVPDLLPPGASAAGPTLHFAVIGDYGQAGPGEAAMAALVKSWKPEIIITTGDNNYPLGQAETIDDNIGRYFHEFISPYRGRFGRGAQENRFFPSLGNHDWYTAGARAYFDYFELPGNERYYDFVRGPVHFFAIDSDENEPDGIDVESKQAAWLKAALKKSTSRWQVVYFHHPPYSSSQHGPNLALQWPFEQWGVDLVLSGHDHTYERLVVRGLPYVVIGVGGRSLYPFTSQQPGSQFRDNSIFGAVRMAASNDAMVAQFVTIDGKTRDELRLPP